MQLFLDGKVELRPGDCRDVIKAMPDNSIDSIVCDPPYALVSIQKRFGGANAKPTKDGDVYMRSSAGFMSKTWDTGETAFATEFWAEVYRVLKPGGHVVAFSGTRTYHRMTVAIEDAGFEIRDQLAWVYGSGFPKSHDVSKAIDKSRAGLKFAEIREYLRGCIAVSGLTQVQIKERLGYPLDSGIVSHWVANSQPMVPCWADWSAMKAFLPIDGRYDHLIESAEREKIGEKTSGISNNVEGQRHTIGASSSVVVDITAPATDAARQWQGWGTALKPAWEPICLARKPLVGTVAENVLEHGTGALNVDGCRVGDEVTTTLRNGNSGGNGAFGRDERVFSRENPPGRWPANIVHDGSDEVLAAFPETASGGAPTAGDRNGLTHGDFATRSLTNHGANSGSAARFFYTAKADKLDRIGSKHPTVKPVDLMQWLCRMVTPPGGIVLDPFAGSGSTGEAAWREGFRAILIEREEEYQADIAERLRLADKGPATRKARAIKQAANDNLPLFKGAA